MKIMICGHARHGKDQFCEFMGIAYRSSSEVALDAVIWDVIGHNYSSKEECFEDRVNHRTQWYNLIKQFNTPNRTRLAREILSTNDVYCGIREREEFLQARAEGLFDLSIWVDASKRLPLEPAESITLKATDCDIIIDNNGTLDDLHSKAIALKKALSPALKTPLRNLVTEWADKVFPDRTVQNAIQKLLMEELPEYLLDRGNPLELGDLGVLLYDIAHLDGVDLEEAIRAKMEINLKRTWAIDSATGLLNHTNDESAHYTDSDESGYECINCFRPLLKSETILKFCPHCERLTEIGKVNVKHAYGKRSRLPSPPPVQGEERLNTDNPTFKCPSCRHINPMYPSYAVTIAETGSVRVECEHCDAGIKISNIQGVNHVRGE